MRFSMLILYLFLAGCFGMAPTEVPLPTIDTADKTARNDTLVIMLPGRGDRADAFIREGFNKAGQQHGFDTIAADAHFGYYMKRILLPRLHEDIVLPAHEAGYRNIWFLGISMGGFGSLLYASEYPDQVDGVILIAPFLGDEKGIDEIAASGGLDKWDPETSRMKDYEVGVWKWLRDSDTPVVLGFGESDGMADGYRRVLTDVLAPSSVYTLEGGHKWTTWAPLWNEIAGDLGL
jgi:pimeloyl-ACP methyl ester carboxylesterase